MAMECAHRLNILDASSGQSPSTWRQSTCRDARVQVLRTQAMHCLLELFLRASKTLATLNRRCLGVQVLRMPGTPFAETF
jgi:hypothetical protein